MSTADRRRHWLTSLLLTAACAAAAPHLSAQPRQVPPPDEPGYRWWGCVTILSSPHPFEVLRVLVRDTVHVGMADGREHLLFWYDVEPTYEVIRHSPQAQEIRVRPIAVPLFTFILRDPAGVFADTSVVAGDKQRTRAIAEAHCTPRQHAVSRFRH